jgi:hypothetical protein
MQRVKLVNLKLGDAGDADVEIYAGAAVWNWMQKPEFEMLKEFDIPADRIFWTFGNSVKYQFDICIWADVDDEVAVLLKLSGLCLHGSSQ